MRTDTKRGLASVATAIGIGLILAGVVVRFNTVRVTSQIESQANIPLPDPLIGSTYVRDPRTNLCFLAQGARLVGQVPCNEAVQFLSEKTQ